MASKVTPKISVSEWKQRPGTYRARVTLNGKRRYSYGKTPSEARTKLEAEVEAHERLATAQNLLRQSDSLLAFWTAELLPLYQNTAEATREAALNNVKILSRHTPSTLAVSQLRPADIVSLWASIQREYPNAHTQTQIRSHLARGMRLLSDMKRIPYNYAKEIRKPEIPERTDIPPIGLALHLWWAYRADRYGPFILMTHLLGLDEGEALTVSGKLAAQGIVKVTKGKNRHRKREIHLGPALTSVFGYYARHAGDQLVPAKHKLHTRVEIRCNALGVPYYSFKPYRHTIQTWMMLEAEIPEVVVDRIVGHSSRRTMTRSYTHPKPEQIRRHMTTVERGLGFTDAVLGELRGTEWGTETFRTNVDERFLNLE